MTPTLHLAKEKPVSAPPPDDPLRQFVDHLTSALQLLPKVLESRDAATRAATLAEVRAALREENDRTSRASAAREVLELPEWLTTRQAAQVLEVEVSTVYWRLQEERKAGGGPLTSASRQTDRRRGLGYDREFHRDALLRLAESERKE